MRKTTILMLTGAAMLAAATGANAATITLAPNGSDIQPFGANGGTPTYGQVFTAPVTGRLASFTLSLNGAVGALFGGVGTWNGTGGFAPGYGSPTNLYESAVVASTGPAAYIFNPNIAVTAGSQYVAYLSTFDVAGANASTTMPLASDPANTGYFVFNNVGDPRGNSSWDYFSNFGDVAFSATFAPAKLAGAVPEPATWAMMIGGVGMIGGALRRRRQPRVAVRFA